MFNLDEKMQATQNLFYIICFKLNIDKKNFQEWVQDK